MLVVDASALAPGLTDGGDVGDLVRRRLAGEDLVAPELVDLEVLSVVLRQVRGGALTARRAGLVVKDLQDLPLRRVSHRPLQSRCWELRDNVTPYDAGYVALAEMLDVVLLTGDARLAGAAGVRCEIELLRDREASE